MTIERLWCPWCPLAAKRRGEVMRLQRLGIEPRPTLTVYDCLDWWCSGCGALGGADDIEALRQLVAEPPQPLHYLASARHSGKEGQQRLWQMARLLFGDWRRRGALRSGLELLVTWAQAHISPCPSRGECEAIFEAMAREMQARQERAS